MTSGLQSLDRDNFAAVSRPEAPAGLPRLLGGLLAGPTSLSEHIVRYGRLPSLGSDRSPSRALIELVDQIGRAHV